MKTIVIDMSADGTPEDSLGRQTVCGIKLKTMAKGEGNKQAYEEDKGLSSPPLLWTRKYLRFISGFRVKIIYQRCNCL